MNKTRRILAIIGIVLLLAMYLVCLILAVAGKHEATTLFKAALGATIAVPIVLYAFLMLLKVFPPFVKNDETDGAGSVGTKDADASAGEAVLPGEDEAEDAAFSLENGGRKDD